MSKPVAMTQRKDNQSYYDEFANWYEKERHDGYHALIDELEFDLIEPYVRQKTVLEVGCGTGLILQRSADVAERAVGIDISPGMLEKAHDRGLEVAVADVTNLPFDDNTFDVVYSMKVLAHVQEIDKALVEMTRVTKRGGVMILEFYNKFSARYLAKRIGGPRKISQQTHEGAVFTRWDSPIDLARRIPENVSVVDYAGVRVLTPFAAAHKVPIVKSALSIGEFWARDSMLRYFGGFLIVILEKDLN